MRATMPATIKTARYCSALGVALLVILGGAGLAAAAPAHGIAIRGEPALPPGFDHFPYANPDAPKGGRVTYGVVGTFDSLNPLIVQGGTTSARGISDPVFGPMVFEPLMVRSADEPFTLYGLLAESVETPPDRGWVEFTLNPKARFSDGVPVTIDDVIFSIELLRDKGNPNFKARFSKIESMERVGERGIRLHIEHSNDRELPLILALTPILPKHAINPDTFDKSTLTPIIGSGPYVLASVRPPDSTVFKRNPDYWGKDLPVKRGFDNFDEIRIDYYRDAATMFEAFKKGLYDVQPETDPSAWQTAYNFPAVNDGRVVRETFHARVPKGMQGFVFNTRRPIFADVRVRRALASLLDFDWINKNLYFGAYARSEGYYNDSDLSSIGRPADEWERALLAPFPNAVAADVMAGTYHPAAGGDRDALRQAVSDLQAAGYALRGSTMVNAATGAPFRFEIMVTNKEDEKLGLAYQRTLGRIGIQADIRMVDAAQFQLRRKTFDFDVMRASWAGSLSPGNEQVNRWSPQVADTEGSFNYPGAREPAIDALIAAMLAAETPQDFDAAVRAYDRVLISGFYAVPLFYLPEQWVARWSRIGHPDSVPLMGYNFETWWARPGS